MNSNAISRFTLDSLFSNNRIDLNEDYIEERLSFKITISCKVSFQSRSSSNLKKSNSIIFFLIMAIVFFCCQLPVRIFQCWSYLQFYANLKNETDEVEPLSEFQVKIINIISQALSLIYFMQCLSNPIIYNIQSTQFRRSLCFKMARNRKPFIV